jgi:uncharacterized membrane protein YeaQ/YmgE (transglycosylase-associated protein family)
LGDLLVMIILGLIVGAVAKFIMPGDDPGGMIVTILIGIAGAVVGGFLGRALGLYQAGEPAGFRVGDRRAGAALRLSHAHALPGVAVRPPERSLVS